MEGKDRDIFLLDLPLPSPSQSVFISLHSPLNLENQPDSPKNPTNILDNDLEPVTKDHEILHDTMVSQAFSRKRNPNPELKQVQALDSNFRNEVILIISCHLILICSLQFEKELENVLKPFYIDSHILISLKNCHYLAKVPH